MLNAPMFFFRLVRRRPYATLAGLLVLLVWLGSTQDEEKCGISGDYDVFLSFRGGDTRTGFTDFLYNSLVAEGVRVFRDEDDLPVGEEISSELNQAIKNSKIAIPIISKDYDGSKHCLRELAEMNRCREACGQLIFPIFYKVSVDEVQELKGRVGEALHSLNSTDGAEAMSQWEEALQSVAQIKGWESRRVANGHEGVLVHMVVNKVVNELKTISANSATTGNMIILLKGAAHRLVMKRSDVAESRYQVFLNFYEEDTRAGFTDFLYISLVNAGVRVFSIDDPSLIGKDFAEEVYNVIKNSKISIPIISQHYASSTWCLGELSQMMDCKKRTKQKLIPIFYKVMPSQVRHVTDTFEEALTHHREKGFNESVKWFNESVVDEWEQALRTIATCKGLESEKIANGHEGILVKQVVKEVLSELNKTQSSPRFNDGYNHSPWLGHKWHGVKEAVTTVRPAVEIAFDIIWPGEKIPHIWPGMKVAIGIIMVKPIIDIFIKLRPYVFYIFLFSLYYVFHYFFYYRS